MAAAPVLPTAKNDGDVVDNDWVDKVRALLAWRRNEIPLLTVAYTQTSVATGTATAVDFSDGSGSFNTAPATNVGGWTAATGSNEGVLVPYDGLYRISADARWDNDDQDGVRSVVVTDGGTVIDGGRSTADPPSASDQCQHHLTTLHYFTDGDELGVDVYQDSGSSLDVLVILRAQWVNSATS